MTHSHALHLYKAGARIARTGGDDRRTVDRWCRSNRLTGRSADLVWRGFRDEVALRRMLGSDRTGHRLGRTS